jgi:hypothetical protein
MDCREAQDRFLENMESTLSPLEKTQLERHISKCAECGPFAALQSELDLRLEQATLAPKLSPAFRAGLQQRIALHGREPWPDWLPDVAHLAGCAAAVAVCAALLPFPVPVVLGAGVVIAFVTYSLQALLVSALEQKTE